MTNDHQLVKNDIGTEDRPTAACAAVNAGVCGFTCRIQAWKIDKSAAGLEISESECQQIQQFSDLVSKLTLREIFMPVTRNPVYLAAQKSGCHASCPIPMAVLKTAEVAMEMALPREVSMRFEPCKGEKD
ncbi:MAG: hypothetical protein PVH85_19335 [Desulfobacterales bacterium]|jgi:hypothetical protein